MMKTYFRNWAWALAIGSLGISSMVSASSASGSTSTVNVVGYSIVKGAYTALEAAFKTTPDGSGVAFTNSFGASGTQAANVAAGQPADVVNLSLEPDVATLVTAGKVSSSWSQQETAIAGVNPSLLGKRQVTVYPTPGIVTDSVVVFVVRPGNPEHITSWSDLTKAGVSIITPDPRSSGSAKWNLLAAYSSALSLGKTSAKAQDFLKSLLANVTSQPTSGSAALASFLAGNGDVLLAYESDALAAVAAKKAVQIVTPPQSLLIENPLALTVTGQGNAAAVAFYKFLFSSAGQIIWAQQGFRPVLKSVVASSNASFPKFVTARSLLTVSTINSKGWPAIDSAFFSPTITFGSDKHHPIQGIVTYLEQQTGH
jgi:sulfate transport system substrate-binding protein